MGWERGVRRASPNKDMSSAAGEHGFESRRVPNAISTSPEIGMKAHRRLLGDKKQTDEHAQTYWTRLQADE